MPKIDLTEDERAELLRLLRAMIAADRFPLSPRMRCLKAIAAKLDPVPPVEPFPAPKPAERPRYVLAKKRRPR